MFILQTGYQHTFMPQSLYPSRRFSMHSMHAPSMGKLLYKIIQRLLQEFQFNTFTSFYRICTKVKAVGLFYLGRLFQGGLYFRQLLLMGTVGFSHLFFFNPYTVGYTNQKLV